MVETHDALGAMHLDGSPMTWHEQHADEGYRTFRGWLDQTRRVDLMADAVIPVPCDAPENMP